MVDFWRSRFFDPKFIQFGLTALILKIALHLIQSQTRPTMNSDVKTVSISQGNSSSTIHLHGATVTSWIVEGQEMLFVSKNSVMDGTKGIRGGIPVVFPHFGPWKDGPQHGFARTNKWTVKDPSQIGTESITLVLENSDATQQYWNHKFRVEYTVLLASEKQLKMDVVITNTDKTPFSFTFLLHTYFSVPDVTSCEIKGLSGCTFLDKVKNFEKSHEDRDAITVSESFDRIFINTPTMHKLKNAVGNKEIVIEKLNLPDTVVWNPWVENAKSMSDFGNDEYKNMICIEAGAVNTPVNLDPEKSFTAGQILSIE